MKPPREGVRLLGPTEQYPGFHTVGFGRYDRDRPSHGLAYHSVARTLYDQLGTYGVPTPTTLDPGNLSALTTGIASWSRPLYDADVRHGDVHAIAALTETGMSAGSE